MAKEMPGVTDRDEREQEFQSKWESWDEDSRLQYVQEIRSTQSGLDRKVRELNEGNKSLQQLVDKFKESGEQNRAQESEEMRAFKNDLDEFRAQKALIRRQAETLQRAAEGQIPLDVALQFAELDDAPALVERLEDVINARANQITNQRLADSDPHMITAGDNAGPITWADIMRMSPGEQKRIPQAIIDRAMQGGD